MAKNPSRKLAEAAQKFLAGKSRRELKRVLALRQMPVARRARPLSASKAWQKWELDLFGKATDQQIAKKTGRSAEAVNLKRRRLGLPPVYANRWLPSEDAILGTMPDREAAKLLGRSFHSVLTRRCDKKIPPVLPGYFWQPHELALLGKYSDREVAKRTGHPVQQAGAKRRSLGIPMKKTSRTWSPDEIALLGQIPDRVLAPRIACSRKRVRAKRLELGIPVVARGKGARTGEWTPADDQKLRELCQFGDKKAAQELGRAVKSVAWRRGILGLPAANLDPRHWTKAEDQMLRTGTDIELARKMNRSLGAIIERRRLLHIPAPAPENRTRKSRSRSIARRQR